MSITKITTNVTGLIGVNPRIDYIETDGTDSLSTVTAAGFLPNNTLGGTNNIQSTDIVLVNYDNSTSFFKPSITDGVITLSASSSIPDGSITTAKLAAANVTLAKLATGITPSHVVKFAGKHTTVGGSATEAVTVTGVAATDIVIATLQSATGTPRTLLTSAPTTNTLTFVFSGDPSTTHIVSYQVLRAAA